MNYQLIAFDLDGTLTRSRTIISHTQAKLLLRLLNHYQIAIISGADWPQFNKQLIDNLPIESSQLTNLYILPTNGGKLYHKPVKTWQQIWSVKLSPSAKTEIRQAFRKALRQAEITVPADKIKGRQLDDRGSQMTWSALGQSASLGQKQIWDPDHQKRKHLIKYLTRLLPEYEIKSGGTTSIDITPRGQTKAQALRQLSHRLKLPLNQILYIGDALFPGGNDYSVKQAGFTTRAVTGPTDTGRLLARLIAGRPIT